MDPEQQRRWDEWADARAEKMMRDVFIDAIAEFTTTYVQRENTKLREEIGQLRADLTLARAVMKGEILEICARMAVMSPENVRAVDQALGDPPLDDRVAALVVSTITRRPQAVPAIFSMIATATAMTRELPLTNRVQLAEIMLDAADEIERRRQVVHID